MNWTKTLRNTLLTLSCLIAVNFVHAQPGQGTPPQPSKRQMTEMVNELTTALVLTESQQIQVSKLFQEHLKEMKSLTGQGKRSKRPDRQAMEAMRADFENQIKSLLNADQAEAFETFQANHKPHSQNSRTRP
jgi:hypothetical protein